MLRSFQLTLAASLLIASQASAAAAGGPATTLHAQMVQVMDMNGFERPTPALFVFIPVGWRAQGGVQWGQQYACNNGYNFNWLASSPDGLQTVAMLPQDRWESNNYGAPSSSPGCRVQPISSLKQYLQQAVSRAQPGARVLDFRPRPDLMALLAAYNRRTPMPMGESRTWVESGEVLFAFTQDGHDMRGVITASAIFSLMRNSSLGNGQTMDALSASVLPGFVATAPNGQLNLRMTEAIRQSFVANPGWQQAIANHNLRIAQGAAVEVAKRAKIIAETNDYISLIRKETYEARGRSEDRIAHDRGNLIRGEETYNDPGAPGGQVQLSNLYNNAWKLNDGSYVLSDDAGFDPWKDLHLEGKRLEPAR